MWTDSTNVLQLINFKEKQPIFVADRVCEIFEYTSVDQWNHIKTKDKPAETGTRGMSTEVLHLSSWVKGPHFLTKSCVPFVPNKDVIINLNFGVKNSKIHYRRHGISGYISQKQLTPVPSVFPFDKFSSYQ